MDKVCESNPNIVLLGDFKTDLLKPQPTWSSATSLFGLRQQIRCATRITQTSATLLDHIYTNNEQMLSKVRVSDISVSDHCPVICTWSCKQPKNMTKGQTTVQYHCFKHFDQDAFLWDLSLAPFANVFSFSDPNQALIAWPYEAFLPVVKKHAPIRRWRVKHPTFPQWLSSEIIKAMKLRDRLKRDKKCEDYKKERNKVTSLVTAAHKKKLTSQNWSLITKILHHCGVQ